MDERVRHELGYIGERFATIVARLGAPDLYLIVVEAPEANAGAFSGPIPTPPHLRGAPPAGELRDLVTADMGFRLFYFGDPTLLRAFDALSYRAGSLIRPHEDDPHPDDHWHDMMAWPILVVDQLQAEGADHLFRLVERPPDASVVWLADDVFSLSAMVARTLAFPWAECSQTEIAHFNGVEPRTGYLAELERRQEIEVREMVPPNRYRKRVRYLDASRHFELLEWLRDQRKAEGKASPE